jgi:hypothetical protein
VIGKILRIGSGGIVFLVLTFAQIHGSPAGIDNPSPKDRLLSEYPTALKRLEQLYASEMGKATLSITDKQSGVRSSSEIRFACDAGLSRSIEVERGTEPKDYSEVVQCSNLNYSFRLARSAPDRPYVIRDVVDGTGRLREFGRYYFEGYFAAPYIAFGLPIRDLMERPEFEFKLKDVSEVTEEGRRLVKMSFEIRWMPDVPVMSAWIKVDPEFGWALCRAELILNPSRNIKRDLSVDYSGMVRGRPVVRRVLDANFGAERVLDVTEIEFDRHPDPRDFTLSAFGLPEVNQKPGDTRAIPLNYWLFGFGAIALALAIFIRRARHQRPAEPVGQSV